VCLSDKTGDECCDVNELPIRDDRIKGRDQSISCFPYRNVVRCWNCAMEVLVHWMEQMPIQHAGGVIFDSGINHGYYPALRLMGMMVQHQCQQGLLGGAERLLRAVYLIFRDVTERGIERTQRSTAKPAAYDGGGLCACHNARVVMATSQRDYTIYGEAACGINSPGTHVSVST